ncbi:hypothetical protein NKDENANG_01339 [Candidatus Entotheonellaceae bacterium PAL068K]
MQEYFYTLAAYLTSLLRGAEVYTCAFRGEDSDFVRFNRRAIRQAGTITPRSPSLDLIAGEWHAARDMALSGDLESDQARMADLVHGLREKLPYPPYLPPSTTASTLTGTSTPGATKR